MKDFAPVLWILIAGGAMAYSAVSNAKKQAQKAKRHPNSEAWPTQIAGNEEPEMPFAPKTRQSNTSETEPWSFDQEYEEQGASEIHSLETPKPAADKRNPDAERFTSLNRDIKAEQQATAHQTATVDQIAGSTEMPEELFADFDLRKAVIYSEILKPKFDE